MLVARIAVTLALAAVSYYVGREVGRAAPIREALRQRREARKGEEGMAPEEETDTKNPR